MSKLLERVKELADRPPIEETRRFLSVIPEEQSMSNPIYYFDTNALLKYYKQYHREETGVIKTIRLVLNYSPIFISNLTILECCHVLMKAKRRGLVRTRRITNFYQRLGKDIEVEIFKIVPVSEASFKLAVNIIMEEAKTASIGSNDALHLAIVKKLLAQPIMVTLDHPMQNVCKRQTIPFFDPETVDTDSPVS